MDDKAPEPKWRVSSRQRNRARALRGNLTDAERVLWQAVRAHRLEGAAFRRQVPVGPFIVDFVCRAAGLILEIDGGQHYEDVGRARDQRRDAFLIAQGFRVLRFSNLDVLNNLDGVLEVVSEAIRDTVPPPNPPPQAGEG